MTCPVPRKPNRTRVRQPKRGRSWCGGCDGQLVPFGGNVHQIPEGSIGNDRVRWLSNNGTVKPVGEGLARRATRDVVMNHIPKKAAGRILDGREWSEYPEVSHAVQNNR